MFLYRFIIFGFSMVVLFWDVVEFLEGIDLLGEMDGRG